MSDNSQELISIEVTNNLIAKMNSYVERSVEEENKLVIFTDDRNGCELGRKIPNSSIRTEWPLVPIPKAYNRARHDEFTLKIIQFVRHYTFFRLKKYDLWITLFDSGGLDTPEINLLFNEERPQIDLKKALHDIPRRCCLRLSSVIVNESSKSGPSSSTPSIVANTVPQIKSENKDDEN